ncbi:MAG: pilus assembly FimT family protein [Bacillota bacterium]
MKMVQTLLVKKYLGGSENGFTLLEIIIVLSLFGIMIGSVSLRLEILEQVKLRMEIIAILNDLKWARTEAILNKKDYHFKIESKDFNNDGRKYYYFYILENNEEQIMKKGSYSDEYKLYKTKSANLVTADYYDYIKFTAFGTARGSTIGLGEEDLIEQIVVSNLGRIRIAE